MKRLSVLEELLEHGARFDFFQAVRLMTLARGGYAPVGHDRFSEEEVARFRPWLSLCFPPSEIREIEARDDGPWQVVVSFMGLYGPLGVLPFHYTELLVERESAIPKDPALREFLDILNHRMISLFFRAQEKYRYASIYRESTGDPITTTLESWMGWGARGARSSDDRPLRHHLLRYVGLFTQRPRSVEALEAVLHDYFGGLTVEIEQFVGRWVSLPPSDRGRLSDVYGTNRLGRTAIIGSRIRDRQGKFRVRLGPLRMAEYLAFQPEGEHYDELCALVREYVGDHFAFDVQPVLHRDDVPRLQRLGRGWPPLRLGRTTWLVSARPERHAADAAFEARTEAPFSMMQRSQLCSTST